MAPGKRITVERCVDACSTDNVNDGKIAHVDVNSHFRCELAGSSGNCKPGRHDTARASSNESPTTTIKSSFADFVCTCDVCVCLCAPHAHTKHIDARTYTPGVEHKHPAPRSVVCELHGCKSSRTVKRVCALARDFPQIQRQSDAAVWNRNCFCQCDHVYDSWNQIKHAVVIFQRQRAHPLGVLFDRVVALVRN